VRRTKPTSWHCVAPRATASTTVRTVEGLQLAVGRPEQAIFLMPGMRSARIFFDPHGMFARYQSDLASFTWAALQPAADRYTGAPLAARAETVHKILSLLLRGEGVKCIHNGPSRTVPVVAALLVCDTLLGEGPMIEAHMTTCGADGPHQHDFALTRCLPISA